MFCFSPAGHMLCLGGLCQLFCPHVFGVCGRLPQAGACRYGVADMELLAQETHKFESHYLDSLVGPYPQVQSQHPTQEDASLLCQSSATWQGRKAFLRNAA
mmetsp:Transcript_12144/g.34167  ORF Transcript_12144/g.34167 Transcript_12144/m.34167 type:complete len:101 (-) Transcript_12144:809-1111(-)